MALGSSYPFNAYGALNNPYLSMMNGYNMGMQDYAQMQQPMMAPQSQPMQIPQQQSVMQQQVQQPVQQSVQQFNPQGGSPNEEEFGIMGIKSIQFARDYYVDPTRTMVFVDYSTGCLYMKRINKNNGKTEFFEYVLKGYEEPSKDGEEAAPETAAASLPASLSSSLEGKFDKLIDTISGLTTAITPFIPQQSAAQEVEHERV